MSKTLNNINNKTEKYLILRPISKIPKMFEALITVKLTALMNNCLSKCSKYFNGVIEDQQIDCICIQLNYYGVF